MSKSKTQKKLKKLSLAGGTDFTKARNTSEMSLLVRRTKTKKDTLKINARKQVMKYNKKHIDL